MSSAGTSDSGCGRDAASLLFLPIFLILFLTGDGLSDAAAGVNSFATIK